MAGAARARTMLAPVAGRVGTTRRVVRVAVLPEELTVENGTLTRTMKPRRDRVLARYAMLIEELYR